MLIYNPPPLRLVKIRDLKKDTNSKLKQIKVVGSNPTMSRAYSSMGEH